MKPNEMGSLIRAITSNVNLYINSKIEKNGIGQGQYEYFLLIYNNPGINQLELSRIKNVGKASVTKALKILEKDGFIKRSSDIKDKRSLNCFTTKKGDKIVHELLDVKTNVEADIFSGFSENDIASFYRYLNKLYENSKMLAQAQEKSKESRLYENSDAQ